ncbi:MAG: type I-U CRISPR-associated protein Csx17 [Verrucomicrobia bacterium]|nr:type I-U CRISPR-associated protein Csx17 [Verrucomicrobiota bacterium]
MPVLTLHGCPPEPLGNYLKALGVFRLVAEQLDSTAVGWWQDGLFLLNMSATAAYSDDKGNALPLAAGDQGAKEWLSRWFRTRCEYSAFVAPWLKNTMWRPGGARSSDAAGRATQILSSQTSCFSRIKRGFQSLGYTLGFECEADDHEAWLKALAESGCLREWSKILDSEGSGESLLKEKAAVRLEIVRRLRNHATEPTLLLWLDVAGFETRSSHQAELNWFPLFEKGGQSGNSNYLENLEAHLIDCLLSSDPELCADRLRAALFAAQSNNVRAKALCGLFFPANRARYNMGQCAEWTNTWVNPWDFILLLEGALAWAGSVTRHHGAARKEVAFPFYARATLGGHFSAGVNESGSAEKDVHSGEVWCPVWTRPAGYSEVMRLFSEGRMQLGKKQARNATDFACAVARLGHERGIGAFKRFGLIRRVGSWGKQDQTQTIAVPLGSYVPHLNQDLMLLDELHDFLSAVASKVQIHDSQPRRIVLSRKSLENAVFTAASTGLNVSPQERRATVIEVLVEAASLEREFARTKGAIKAKMGRNLDDVTAPVLASLSTRWLWTTGQEAPPRPFDDGTSEFRLARAIASIPSWGDPSKKRPDTVGPIRENLVPVQRFWEERMERFDWTWWPESRRAVWSTQRDLFENFASILERRLIDGQAGTGDGLPLWSRWGVSFDDLLALWNRELDEARISDFVHGLSAIQFPPDGQVSITKLEVLHDPTPDLSCGRIWFFEDEPRMSHSVPKWEGKPLIGRRELDAAFALPRSYALLKLCFVGGRVPARPVEEQTAVRSGTEPFPPGYLEIFRLLLAGRGREACNLSCRLLRARGYPTLLESRLGRAESLQLSSEECCRLAGLILVPVRHPGVLAGLVIKPQQKKTT